MPKLKMIESKTASLIRETFVEEKTNVKAVHNLSAWSINSCCPPVTKGHN